MIPASNPTLSSLPPLRIALLQLDLGFVAYDEIFTAVTDSLEQTGATVRTVPTARDADPAQDDLLLIVGTPNFYPTLLADLAALRARTGPSLPVFLWHLEHLPDLDMPAPILWAQMLKNAYEARRRGGRYGNSRAGNYLVIRQGVRKGLFDKVLVFTRRKADFLARCDLAAEYVPLGHHPLWGEDYGAERDIDVLFLGEVRDDRRGKIVRAVSAELAGAGVALKTMYDFNPVGVWGEERNALLNRTKVFLSVYRHPSDSSGMRFSLGMGNGALVVSEPVLDPFPFVAGEHFIEAPIPRLAGAILSALGDEALRERTRRAATRFLRESYTLPASAEQIVALARQAGPRGPDHHAS